MRMLGCVAGLTEPLKVPPLIAATPRNRSDVIQVTFSMKADAAKGTSIPLHTANSYDVSSGKAPDRALLPRPPPIVDRFATFGIGTLPCMDLGFSGIPIFRVSAGIEGRHLACIGFDLVGMFQATCLGKSFGCFRVGLPPLRRL